MTCHLDRLPAALAAADPVDPASFAGPEGAAQGTWHATRVTLSRQDHVDRDGTREAGAERRVERLDGRAGTPAMGAGRLAGILARARDALPGSGAAPLRVLLRGRLLSVSGVAVGAVRMAPVASACRPAMRHGCCA